MDGLLVMLLWCAFLLTLWWLHAGLNHVEATLRQAAADSLKPVIPPSFDEPEEETETIGQYMGAPIHRSIVIAGKEYRYDRILPPDDRVLPPGPRTSVDADERCVAPGIVYAARQAIVP